MRQGIIIFIGIISALISLVLMSATTPDTVGPVGILAFFVSVYVLVVCGVYLLLAALMGVMIKILKIGTLRSNIEDLSSWKLYYYASVLGLAPVIILGMQSVGHVKIMDLGLLVAFEALACFYIHKRF